KASLGKACPIRFWRLLPSGLQVVAQRSNQCRHTDCGQGCERHPAIMPLATEREIAGAERGRCRIERDEHQTTGHGLARKEPVIEQRQKRGKRNGSHQCQYVGTLLGGFARPRERHGNDRWSSYPCDSLDETTG